jgi:hypothetical protein
MSRRLIVAFPPSCWLFEANQDIPRGTQVQPMHVTGFLILVTTPITIKAHDVLYVDIRSGQVQVIERGGIAIYRSGWLN